MYTTVMIRFGELNTKGKNKIMFINTLLRNVKHALKDFSKLEISKTHDRIYIELNGEAYHRTIKTADYLLDEEFEIEKEKETYLKEIIENDECFYDFVSDAELIKTLKTL